MTVQDLYEEHRELFRIGDKLIEIAAFDPPRMQELVAARREMAQAVARREWEESAFLPAAERLARAEPLRKAS